MSNTIRLTNERGEVRWGKSLSYDGAELARRTDTAWIAQDVDWPDRDDYPRWHLPRGTKRPTRAYVGGIVIGPDGTVRFPGPLTDERIAAVVEAGAVVTTDLDAARYDEQGAVIHYQFVDWTTV